MTYGKIGSLPRTISGGGSCKELSSNDACNLLFCNTPPSLCRPSAPMSKKVNRYLASQTTWKLILC